MSFLANLRAAQAATGSVLCVGLDPDPALMPKVFGDCSEIEAVQDFCYAIGKAVAPYACAFKPNLAFFEALGPDGWHALKEVLDALPEDRLIILDAKRGDIGNTAEKYAHALYEELGGDAVTVAPYMGQDSVVPFLQDEDRCAFVLAATSNPSAAAVQQLQVGEDPLYQHVARMAVRAGEEQPGTVGLVVGATKPDQLAGLRYEFPTTPFLVPGVGAQGGKTESVLESNARGPIIVSSSRSILYASDDGDYARAAADAARRLSRHLVPE